MIYNIQNLPEEAIIPILQQLPVSDALTMSIVSKLFHRLSNDQRSWKSYCHRDFEIQLFTGFETDDFPLHPDDNDNDWKSFFQKVFKIALHRFGKLKILGQQLNKYYYTYTVRNVNERSIELLERLTNECKQKNLDIKKLKFQTTIILDTIALSEFSELLTSDSMKEVLSKIPSDTSL